MEQKIEVCKNCGYAAKRTDLTKGRFPWCEYICTYPAEDDSRHIAYKYKHDTCEHFMPTERPEESYQEENNCTEYSTQKWGKHD